MGHEACCNEVCVSAWFLVCSSKKKNKKTLFVSSVRNAISSYILKVNEQVDLKVFASSVQTTLPEQRSDGLLSPSHPSFMWNVLLFYMLSSKHNFVFGSLSHISVPAVFYTIVFSPPEFKTWETLIAYVSSGQQDFQDQSIKKKKKMLAHHTWLRPLIKCSSCQSPMKCVCVCVYVQFFCLVERILLFCWWAVALKLAVLKKKKCCRKY